MKTTYQEFAQGMSLITTNAIVKFNNEQTEPYLVINSNTREIMIPDSMQNIGVIGDHNAETVWFKIDKFFDMADLGGSIDDYWKRKEEGYYTYILIQFINANQQPYIYLVPAHHVFSKDFISDETSGSLDTVIFPWILTKEVTETSGIVRFAIRIFKTKTQLITDENGNITNKDTEVVYSYNTQYAQFNILTGINNTNAPNASTTILPSQIEDIFDTITKIYIEGMKLVDRPEGTPETTSIISHDYNYLYNIPKINGVELKGDVDPALILSGLEGDTMVTVNTLDQTLDINSNNAVANKAIAAKFQDLEANIDNRFENVSIDVDNALSETSENPVQNKVLYQEIQALWEEMGGLTYIPIDLLSFNVSPKYFEQGYMVENDILYLTWEVSKDVSSIELLGAFATEDNEGTPISISPDSEQPLQLTDYNSFDANRTFTLTVKDNKGEDSLSVEVKFVPGLYYGITTNVEVDDDLFATLTKQLSETRELEFTVTADEGEYIIFASPEDYGECVFKVGGFDGGFEKISTFEYTNQYDYTTNYFVYKSSNTNLGTTKVQVL